MNTNYIDKKLTETFVLGAIVAFSMGITSRTLLDKFYRNDKLINEAMENVYVKDVNHDSLQDIIDPVHKKIYLQQKDGKFIEFEEYPKNRIDSLVKYGQENANNTLDSLKNIYFGNTK